MKDRDYSGGKGGNSDGRNYDKEVEDGVEGEGGGMVVDEYRSDDGGGSDDEPYESNDDDKY